jgi:hypothetical protein
MGNLVSGLKIKRVTVFLALVSLAAFWVGCESSSTTADEHEGFTGFWMAVDQTDGGFNRLSLTENADGTINLGLSETHVSSCLGGRGTLSGSGVLDAGVLTVPITIQCLSGEEATYNKPKGDPIGPLPVTFEFVGDNLIEFYFAPIELRVSYHRISSD